MSTSAAAGQPSQPNCCARGSVFQKSLAVGMHVLQDWTLDALDLDKIGIRRRGHSKEGEDIDVFKQEA